MPVPPFSYKKTPEEGQRVYVLSPLMRVKHRKLDDLVSILSFVNAADHPVPIPAGVILQRIVQPINVPVIVPPAGESFILVWSESYTLALAGQPIMHIKNHRAQSISTGHGIDITYRDAI